PPSRDDEAARRLELVPAPPGSDTVAVDTSPEARLSRRRALRRDATVYAGFVGFLVLIWALTSRGYFWPVWPLIVFGVPLAVRGWIVFLDDRPRLGGRQWMTHGLAVQAGISVALFAFFFAVWAVTSRGYFWPVWPLLALAILLGIRAYAA